MYQCLPSTVSFPMDIKSHSLASMTKSVPSVRSLDEASCKTATVLMQCSVYHYMLAWHEKPNGFSFASPRILPLLASVRSQVQQHVSGESP